MLNNMFVIIKFYHFDLNQSAVDKHTFGIAVLDPSAFSSDYGFFEHET